MYVINHKMLGNMCVRQFFGTNLQICFLGIYLDLNKSCTKSLLSNYSSCYLSINLKCIFKCVCLLLHKSTDAYIYKQTNIYGQHTFQIHTYIFVNSHPFSYLVSLSVCLYDHLKMWFYFVYCLHLDLLYSKFVKSTQNVQRFN